MIFKIQRQLKNKKGFTLVELMVVVAIIAVLVAIAIPAYNKVTEQAEEKACLANIRTIEGMIPLYLASYPDKSIGDLDSIDGDLDSIEDFKIFFQNKEIPTCPSGGKYKISKGKVSCVENDNEFEGHSKKD